MTETFETLNLKDDYVREPEFLIPGYTSVSGHLAISSAGWNTEPFISSYGVDHGRSFSSDTLISMRLTYAAHELNSVVDITPDKAGGAPVLKGTRFKVAQILAELAQDHSISYLDREYGLNRKSLTDLLDSLAMLMDRPFRR